MKSAVYFVDLAAQADYAAITNSVNESNTDEAVEALILAPSWTIDTVHRKKGIDAVFSDSPDSFTASLGRIFERVINLEVATRLVDMGVSCLMLSTAVLQHLPDWGVEFLKGLSKTHTDTTWHLDDHELIDIVRASSRPGELLCIAMDVFGMVPECILHPDKLTKDDSTLVERVLYDRKFSVHPSAELFIRHIALYFACNTGSDGIIAAFEAFAAGSEECVSNLSQDAIDWAVRMCKNKYPNIAVRMSALRGR